MDEQRANDMLQAVAAQREFFANQVVQLQADLMAAHRQIEELTKDKKEE